MRDESRIHMDVPFIRTVLVDWTSHHHPDRALQGAESRLAY
jgi:hypothetical protein